MFGSNVQISEGKSNVEDTPTEKTQQGRGDSEAPHTTAAICIAISKDSGAGIFECMVRHTTQKTAQNNEQMLKD
jgi:hypothetical protein